MPDSVNYAAKYAPQIDARFKLGLLTQPLVNSDFAPKLTHFFPLGP